MATINSLLIALSTPKFVRTLQRILSQGRPLTQDGFFGPNTGKALGEAFLNKQLPSKYRDLIPNYSLCYYLQSKLLKPRYPELKADGYFGPATGEALGGLILNGFHIPRYEPPDWYLRYVKKKEGCPTDERGMAIAYRCPTGHWTIGFGRTAGVQEGDKITMHQAETNLIEDINDRARQLEELLSHSIGEGMFWALLDLGYNLGMGWLEKESSALRLTNARDYHAAAEWFEPVSKGWVDGEMVTLPGLLKRRQDEREWYEGDLCI